MHKGQLNESRAFVNLSKVWKDVTAFPNDSKDDIKGFDGRLILSDGTPCRYQVKSSMFYCEKFMQHEDWARISKFTALLLVRGSEVTFVHIPERMKVDMARIRKFNFFHIS